MNCNCSRISLHQFQFQYIPKPFRTLSAVFHSCAEVAVTEVPVPRCSFRIRSRLYSTTINVVRPSASAQHKPLGALKPVTSQSSCSRTMPKGCKVSLPGGHKSQKHSKSSEVGDSSSHKKEINSSASRLNQTMILKQIPQNVNQRLIFA